MQNASQIPVIAEPWFTAFYAGIEIHPVMVTGELAKAGGAIGKAVKKNAWSLEHHDQCFNGPAGVFLRCPSDPLAAQNEDVRHNKCQFLSYGGTVVMKQRKITAIAKVSIVLLLACCSIATAGTIPVVPDALKVPASQALSLETQATGVQIYQCKASKDDPKRFEWVFKAPEAELFDNAGKKIGRHFAGPTWESNDGSKVVGEVRAQYKSPDPNSVTWLLLSAKSTSGNGIFSKIRSIQRVLTAGGNAPAGGCNQAQIGKEMRIPYKAIYNFYTARP